MNIKESTYLTKQSLIFHKICLAGILLPTSCGGHFSYGSRGPWRSHGRPQSRKGRTFDEDYKGWSWNCQNRVPDCKIEKEICKLENPLYIVSFFFLLVIFILHLQQEQEEHANKPMSDSNEEVEEKPKNQSIAQIIYNENRVSLFSRKTKTSSHRSWKIHKCVTFHLSFFQQKAKSSHSMLDKYAVNELPLYNQPSDTDVYHKTKSK